MYYFSMYMANTKTHYTQWNPILDQDNLVCLIKNKSRVPSYPHINSNILYFILPRATILYIILLYHSIQEAADCARTVRGFERCKTIIYSIHTLLQCYHECVRKWDIYCTFGTIIHILCINDMFWWTGGSHNEASTCLQL